MPNAFPGWAASAATSLTYLTGWGESTVPWIVTILLLSIGLAITVSPVVYNTIERVEMVLVVIIVAFLLLAIVVATNMSEWTGIITEAPEGIANFPRYVNEIGITTILGAIAFAGAGGANNLVQSNYVRDKGLAMGANIPNIVSPITGEEEARPSLGYTFPMDEENLRRWRGWWRVANMEQGILFYGIGLLSLIALAVLANSTLGVRPGLPDDLEFIREEAVVLGNTIAPWFATFFLAAAAIKLFSTNIGILDWVSQLTAASLKVSWLARSQFWSESKIYLTVVWTMITVGTIIILTGIEPLILLIIAASGGGVVMALYSTLLLFLNRRALPDLIKLKSYRLVIIALSSLGFIALSIYLLYAVATGEIP